MSGTQVSLFFPLPACVGEGSSRSEQGEGLPAAIDKAHKKNEPSDAARARLRYRLYTPGDSVPLRGQADVMVNVISGEKAPFDSAMMDAVPSTPPALTVRNAIPFGSVTALEP